MGSLLFGTPKIQAPVQAAPTQTPLTSQTAAQLQIPQADASSLAAPKTKKKQTDTSSASLNPSGLQIKS